MIVACNTRLRLCNKGAVVRVPRHKAVIDRQGRADDVHVFAPSTRRSFYTLQFGQRLSMKPETPLEALRRQLLRVEV